MSPEHILLSLLRAAVCGEAAAEMESACTPEMLAQVFFLAEKHDLAHLAGHGLENLALPPCATLEKFQKAKMQAIFRYMKLDHALGQICGCFEEAGIPFVPLKGAFLRSLYPEPWMRTSCDVDVLVYETDLDRAVAALQALGWRVEGRKNYHDISLYSPGGVHLELHFNIRENMESIDRVLDQVWAHSAPVAEGLMEHRQSGEFLLYHLVAHMSYHFLGGGCGIRSVLDIWLLRKHLRYDETVLRQLCRAGELEIFYDAVADLAAVWFESCGHTSVTARMEQVILSGGTYGSIDGSAAFKQVRAGGKWKHLLRRIVMPYASMVIRYPLLKKHKWLTPVFQVVRWIQTLFGGRMGRVAHELKVNRASNAEDFSQAEELMHQLGLCPSEKRM